MVLTMAAVAADKGITRDDFGVRVRMTTQLPEQNGAAFHSEVHLSEKYSDRERRILFNSARACEVHHLLRGPVEFQERLILDAGE